VFNLTKVPKLRSEVNEREFES